MPAEDLAPAIELFRHRFLHALRDAKLISPRRLAHLLTWKHSGFHIDAGKKQRVQPGDHDGRKRLAEYLLRHPFSLQKITWNATTKAVIDWFNRPRNPSQPEEERIDQRPSWRPREIRLDDERILVLDES